MTDYIDRDTAIDEVCDGCNKQFEDEPCDPSWCCIRNRLANLPVEDVTPVVRCEDCVFWVANEDFDGWGWCCNSAIGEKDREENFFCAYGARKE